MKIKSDFVTNSSSSSFIITCDIDKADNIEKYYRITEMGEINRYNNIDAWNDKDKSVWPFTDTGYHYEDTLNKALDEVRDGKILITVVDMVLESWWERAQNPPEKINNIYDLD